MIDVKEFKMSNLVLKNMIF